MFLLNAVVVEINSRQKTTMAAKHNRLRHQLRFGLHKTLVCSFASVCCVNMVNGNPPGFQ